jgi:hypothetical protein
MTVSNSTVDTHLSIESIVPDFLIIGAPKAATTTLWHCMRQHQDIYMPDVKEPRFFSHHFDRGWEWYTSLFATMNGERVLGEASPHYSMVDVFPQASQRIATTLPDAKLIYCVRDPVTALASAWKQYQHNGTTMPGRERMPASFAAALENWPPLLSSVRYWSNLNAFRKHYPDSQILVVMYEDFNRDPDCVLRRCFEFLGVGYAKIELPGIVNASKGKRVFSPVMQKIRSHGLTSRVRRWLPVGTSLAGKILESPVRDPLWTRRALFTARDHLETEIREILGYTNKPRSFWSDWNDVSLHR